MLRSGGLGCEACLPCDCNVHRDHDRHSQRVCLKLVWQGGGSSDCFVGQSSIFVLAVLFSSHIYIHIFIQDLVLGAECAEQRNNLEISYPITNGIVTGSCHLALTSSACYGVGYDAFGIGRDKLTCCTSFTCPHVHKERYATISMISGEGHPELVHLPLFLEAPPFSKHPNRRVSPLKALSCHRCRNCIDYTPHRQHPTHPAKGRPGRTYWRICSLTPPKTHHPKA